jgi:two-component system response regulator VicR
MKRILAVDDEPAILAVVRDILGSQGYTVVGVGSVTEALSQLRVDTFDLVIADLRMPELPGEALIRFLRESERHKDVPIVVLAGDAEEADLGSLRVDVRVSKPFAPATLLTAVSALVG